MSVRNITQLIILPALVVLLGSCGMPGSPDEGGDAPIGSRGWSVTTVLPSPDGRHVAFIGTPRSGDIGRARLVLAGDEPVRLSPGMTTARSMAWMPGSESLLLGYAEEMGGDHPTRFAVIGLDGAVLREIPVEVELKATMAWR